MTQAVDLRSIGKTAVRRQLAGIAFEQFQQLGFERVTFDDLARAAGVSRSTFLRYFGSKEDVVLFVFDPFADAIVTSLRQADPISDVWVQLRRSLDPVLDFMAGEPGNGLPLAEMIATTPTLSARFHEKQAAWVLRMVDHIPVAGLSLPDANIAARALATAAMGCFTVAIGTWIEQNGEVALPPLLDSAFIAISAAAPCHTP